MEKLNMHTPDLVSGNIEKIAALFPSAVTEMRDEDGKIKRGINFEVLKQLLSRDMVDGDERYEFTWVGKKQAIAEAEARSRKRCARSRRTAATGTRPRTSILRAIIRKRSKFCRKATLARSK